MKQYDKIWVPDTTGTYEIKDMDLEFAETNASYLKNKVVLTIEELNEVFRAGHRYADWRYDKAEFANISSPEPPPKFDEYLTSKGIQL